MPVNIDDLFLLICKSVVNLVSYPKTNEVTRVHAEHHHLDSLGFDYISSREEARKFLETARFREYKLSYDIKLSSSEAQAFVNADCKALKLQIKMIHTQIVYFEESIKTLDNLGYAIKNKIEIVSHQLI